MMTRTFFATLLGVGLAAGSALQIFAQNESPMPSQTVTDSGVETVRQAQSEAPAPVEKFVEANALLKKLMKKRKWREGYDEKQKRIIVVEAADFKTADPASDKNFFPKREMAAKKAVLSAKVAVIEFINQEMSAMDQVNMPGTDVNKVLGAERAALDAQLAKQKEAVAQLLAKKNKAEADALRGTTFGDRLNDLIAAAIKKLDKEYDANARDKAARARVKELKEEFEVALRKYNEMKSQAEASLGKIRERQTSAVKTLAKMPLYGATVIMQTESWNKRTGKYQVAVMLCWSYALERSARAIVTGEDYKIKADPKGKTVQEWLEDQNLATMIGPRQYIDKYGNRWFLGVTAGAYDDELSSSTRRRNKGLTESFAKQMSAFCLWADVESYKEAKSALESRGDDKNQRDVVAQSYSENLTQKFQNKTVRGMSRLYSSEVTHPITGTTIYVAVYGINAGSAKEALAAERVNYATKVMDNRHQGWESGVKAANRDAVEKSKNRDEDIRSGYNSQGKALKGELNKRTPKKPAGTAVIHSGNGGSGKKPVSVSGAFSGDTPSSNNF